MTEPRQILLIDDDRDIIHGTNMRLRAVGYKTVKASDGEQGLAAAIANQPDAILLDVRMPGMDGLTMLGKLRQNEATKDIPVIMLSASLVDQKASLDAGARYFLSKPYQARILLAAVKSVLSHTNGNGSHTNGDGQPHKRQRQATQTATASHANGNGKPRKRQRQPRERHMKRGMQY